MYKPSDFTKELYKVGEVAKYLGLSPRTVQMYDVKGLLPFKRSPKGQRIMSKADLISHLDKIGLLEKEERHDVLYARVSGHDQKADLDRQILFLLEHTSDLNKPVILKEIGSGLNDKRPKLLQLINMVMNGEVDRVYITYKDRLTRFGYNYLETVFTLKDTKIIVVKDVNSKTIQEELVDDMMSLIASFSGKLYSLRRNHAK